MKKLLTMIGAAAVAVGAYADTWTDPDTGITWTFSASGSNATLGGGASTTTAMPTDTVLDAANIPWTFTKDGVNYTVTALANFAFGSCATLTGTLTVPESVTSIGEAAFLNVGVSRIASLGGATELKYRVFEGAALTGTLKLKKPSVMRGLAFKNTKLDAIFVPGSDTGTKSFSVRETANGVSTLKVFFIGQNYTATDTTRRNMLSGVTGCKVFAPDTSTWIGLNPGGSNNEVIHYGVNTNLNFVVDDDAGVITATPTDESAFLKVLEVAPLFKTHFGWNTRVNFTNIIEVASGTITSEMLNAVEFNTMLLTFAVKTQAQLDDILAKFPASTYPMLAIDVRPSGSGKTEQLTLPSNRELWVHLPGDGKYTPKYNGLIISFY